jgi:Ser/Thr protein kinase RdoA (MazF antagonist)
LGELMAGLQNHAERWERPQGFVRARVDWPIQTARWLPDPFAPAVLDEVHSLVEERLSAREALEAGAALEQIRAVEQLLRAEEREGSPNFGLIHADLHYWNLLFSDDTVRALDFDDCGLGPWLYDPAVMLSEVLEWQRYPALRAGLLAGYRRVRPLSSEHEALIDTFVALRSIQDAVSMLQDRERWAPGGDWVAKARKSLAAVSHLLR